MIKRRNACLGLLAGLMLGACSRSVDNGWEHLDLEKDGVFGISSFRTFDELLSDKSSDTVIVAVLDDGFDIHHDGLSSMLWVNSGEIPDNGMDDDGNGYADDRHGWNFLGNADSSYRFDNTDLVRLVRKEKKRFGGKQMATIPPVERGAFIDFRASEAELIAKSKEANERLIYEQWRLDAVDAVLTQLDTNHPTLRDIRQFVPKNHSENRVRSILNDELKSQTFAEFYDDLVSKVHNAMTALNYGLNLDFIPLRDQESPSMDGGDHLGNADVKGGEHGTHVAGLIASFFGDQKGGLNKNYPVRIMPVKILGESGLRNEDLAKAIRYAVDNDAKVINISLANFQRSLDKRLLESAVQYAMDHDVVIVHAAGNDSKNLADLSPVLSPYAHDGSRAEAWIEVAGSGKYDDYSLKASFSNYGREHVDVFAPAVDLYSTVDGGGYGKQSGTSGAAPLVAGVAAILRAYFPDLTAIQTRQIIMASVTKTSRLSELCATGGVVNLYKAVQLADTIIEKKEEQLSK